MQIPEILLSDPKTITADGYVTFFTVPSNEWWEILFYNGSNLGGGGNPKIQNLRLTSGGKSIIPVNGSSLITAASTVYENYNPPVPVAPESAIEAQVDFDVGNSVALVRLMIIRHTLQP